MLWYTGSLTTSYPMNVMTIQYPCVSNQRGLQCTNCFAWMYTTCAGVNNDLYDNIYISRISELEIYKMHISMLTFCQFLNLILYVCTNRKPVQRATSTLKSGHSNSIQSLKYDDFDEDGFKMYTS